MTPSPDNSGLDATSPTVQFRREEVINRFEAAWRSGTRPTMVDFLAQGPESDQSSLLRELLKLDSDYRRLAGEMPQQSDYTAMLPEHRKIILDVLSRDPELTRQTLPMSDPDDTATFSPPHGAASQDTTFVPHRGDAVESSTSRIGDYDILGEIARGGMGVVYKAFDRRLNRTVALKLIKSGELADREQIERFHIEARAAAQLDHPGIVQVFEVGQQGGQHYMAMAFVDGGSLWQEVKDAPLRPKRAARVMQQVAEAIQYAHDQGIIHRDLKPQNILLTKDGYPRVTDFGLAKKQSVDSSLTGTGQILGTPSYMPPEQVSGKNKDQQIGPLADVYSLGSTLYCLLTGRPPFQAATPLDTMLQVLEQEPVSPKSLNRGVSVDLETICLRCLEKVPANRYASAGALAQDLERYLAGEPIRARRVGRLERVLKWIARKPVVAAAYGLSALTAALLLIGITIFSFYRSADSARAEAVTARNQAVEAKHESDSARNEAIGAREQTEAALQGEKTARAGEIAARKELEETKAYNQYVLNVRLAPMFWEHGWVADARKALDDCPAELRHWEWRHLWRKLRPETATLTGHTSLIRAMELSPDGKWLAASRETACVWDAKTGELMTRIHAPLSPRSLAFSPDSRHLAMASDPTIEGGPGGSGGWVTIWDVVRNQQVAVFEHPARALSVAYRADGQQLAAGFGDGTVRLWNTRDYAEQKTDGRHPNGVPFLIFQSDHKRLVSACWDGHFKVWNCEEGRVLASLDGATDRAATVNRKVGWSNAVSLQVNPQGTELITAIKVGTVKRWDLDTFQEVGSHREDFEHARLAISDDLNHTASSQFSVRIRDGRTGHQKFELKPSRGSPTSAEFSPDCQCLATGWVDGYIRLWNVDTGEIMATLTGHASGVNRLLFSHDGSLLYSAEFTGQIKIWNLTDQDDVVEFHKPTDNPVAAISPDGRLGASVLDQRRIDVRDLATKALVAQWNESQEIRQLAFSPDSQALSAAGTQGGISFRSVANPSDVIAFTGHTGGVNNVEFSPDGHFLASAGSDGIARLWNISQPQQQVSLVGHQNAVMKVAFNPRGHQLATYAYDGTVRLWDTRDGRELSKHEWEYNFPREPYWLLQFSPDGSRLACTHGKHLRVWDTHAGNEIVRREGTSQLIALAFHPDGRSLVYSGFFPRVHILDLNSLSETTVLAGEQNVLKFNSDGSRLIGACEDQTIRIWDTTTWQEIATLTGHRFLLSAVQFDQQGKNLISASQDGTIRRWMTESTPAEQAERLRVRPLLWRLQEASRAEQSRNWYAAAFHLGWLLRDQSQDESLKSRYDNAIKELKEQGSAVPFSSISQ